ncbi:MAG: protoheme IX farnesyltransferase [Pirellulales bacterium]|nr:protoheme IX farnesyltransferase [Pirellulales bacterium]
MRDILGLIRPRIAALVLFAVAVSAWLASERPLRWEEVCHVLIGTGLLVIGAVAWNQRLEGHSDQQMNRTMDRPVPSGRISPSQAAYLAVLASILGLIYLIFRTHAVVAMLGGLCWLLYGCVYTPIKSISPWQTPVGAIAGAIPMLMGAAVAGDPLGPMGLSLFGIVFCWQFPHSMAIAWRYRHQFAIAGIQLLTVVEPTGRAAGFVAVLGSCLLLPVSLIPFILSSAEIVYGVTAAILGAGYFICSICFLYRRNQATSWSLQHASIVYLPLLLVLMLAAHVS